MYKINVHFIFSQATTSISPSFLMVLTHRDIIDRGDKPVSSGERESELWVRLSLANAKVMAW